jgi:hypothetical protein
MCCCKATAELLYKCGMPFAEWIRTGLAHCHFGRLIVRAGSFFENLVVWIERNCRERAQGNFCSPRALQGRGADRPAAVGGGPPPWGL